MVIWHPEIFLKRACNIFGNLALKDQIKGKKIFAHFTILTGDIWKTTTVKPLGFKEIRTLLRGVRYREVV